jgi:hypothetical protein
MTAHKPNLAILVVRDPDGDTNLTVYVDGERATGYVLIELDAGRGHTREDWEEGRVYDLAEAAKVSDAFLAEVTAAYVDPPGAEYIEDDDETEYVRDDAWAAEVLRNRASFMTGTTEHHVLADDETARRLITDLRITD